MECWGGGVSKPSSSSSSSSSKGIHVHTTVAYLWSLTREWTTGFRITVRCSCAKIIHIYTHNSCLESSKINLAILTHSDPFTGPKLYKTYLWSILSKPPLFLVFFLLPESPLQVIPFYSFKTPVVWCLTARFTGGRQPGSYDGAFDLSALRQFKSCWGSKVAGGGAVNKHWLVVGCWYTGCWK